jgi:SAM-dependent methyltransferase
MRSADFSSFAKLYAEARPTYPAELFAHVASFVELRHLAWDCATGSGQAAVGLAEHFERVIATDVSEAQIAHATRHPRVDYRVSRSESSAHGDTSVDLVTVASALHWFDEQAFYREVRRVARPGGVLAAWSYHVAHAEPPFGDVFQRLYDEPLRPYFAPAAHLVDDRYEGVVLPGEPLPGGTFFATASWTLDQVLAFVRSWSGTQNYVKERGGDPAGTIAGELEVLCGGNSGVRTLRWPLYLRISRL